ncbi:MAG: hypothetical protein ACM3NF_03055 [Gemmatimonadota bacterium]
MPGPAAKVIDGKKHMWDGTEYGSEADANAAAEKYRSEGFEAVVVAGDPNRVYTRRVVTEVKVEGGSPV